jgi:hypothetical protein
VKIAGICGEMTAKYWDILIARGEFIERWNVLSEDGILFLVMVGLCDCFNLY